jgi:hypothetical protein
MRQDLFDAGENQQAAAKLIGGEGGTAAVYAQPGWMVDGEVLAPQGSDAGTGAHHPRQSHLGVRRVRRKIGRLWITIVYYGVDTSTASLQRSVP